MRRRRFRHSNKTRPAAPASTLAADWRDEFLRLKEVEAVLDRRMTDWAEGERRYEAGRLLPSYSMDSKYDIFMEPRVPEIAEKAAQHADTQEDALVLEDPEEILEQVENAVRATDELRATAGEGHRRPRKLLDPDYKPRKRGFFRRVFGGGKR